MTFAGDWFATVARYRFASEGQQLAPDTFIRVYLVISAVPESSVPAQVLVPGPEREGFVAVEWGGTEQ
ncbi:hypothetical protein [Actinomyces sp. MRS3W]|uniref:hypothetical protein n=1 Tax=Actinomyces sp. MRS3W TaxID=2800796 RepID=UPI0028FD0929|nr:hypothetical protein [Actinomyces sp. MRS3W]MDU0349670.1 hypothetical protein [Actinomyces sp. MRS3W]